tara:strand:- start:42 stop:653 length:612 start_codon:yes stop_codon:yes gene_type:complete
MTFGLVKHNNNSISAITSAGQLAQGKMTLLQTQTASSSASINFTSNIDSTYPIYLFKFINIHPSDDNKEFQVNFRDGGSSYDATKTTTYFRAYHDESDSATSLAYSSGNDLANSTGNQYLTEGQGNGSDESFCGEMLLFEPSSTTFVKHFMSRLQSYNQANISYESYVAGYCNVTSAIDGVQFSFITGNIDSGTIKLYGIKGS